MNIIKLATMDHMEWTAVNIAGIAMTTTATMLMEHVYLDV